MAEGKRFMLRLQASQVRALARAGEVLGIGDVQRTIYHCINLGLQQCALVVGQRDQTSVLEAMLGAEHAMLDKHAATVVDTFAVGGPVTPPQSANFGTPSGFHPRKGRKGARHD